MTLKDEELADDLENELLDAVLSSNSERVLAAHEMLTEIELTGKIVIGCSSPQNRIKGLCKECSKVNDWRKCSEFRDFCNLTLDIGYEDEV